MIDVFLFSIAGKKTNQVIDDVIQTFLESEFVPATDKKVLKHTVEVAKNGNYPSDNYYSQFYTQPEFKYKSLSEILTYSKKALDFYKQQGLNRALMTAMNDSNSSNELLTKVEELLSIDDRSESDEEFDDFKPVLYSDEKGKPETLGIQSGVSEIDTVTNGFQYGCILAICAFTSHGKSTLVDSILFKNALEGKKCCIVSLELAPRIVWSFLQARYLYQVKGLQVSSQDILFRKLTSDTEKKVSEYDEDFKRDICDNLLIIDESLLPKKVVTNYQALMKLFRKIESKLGGLDLVAFDHVGQFELMFPTMGNQILKVLQSVAKTYVNKSGTNISMIWAVQCNREGEKRARKRGGVYDMQAISDLNEVERSATYVLFMYTSDDMKVVQETKMTLSKHRLGSPITEPITVNFNPAISTVGSTVEKVQMSDDELSDLGGFDFDDDF